MSWEVFVKSIGGSSFKHGATAYKKRGCRCDVCRAANNQQRRQWMARQGGRIPDRVHGTSGGYQNYRCRCRPCTDAQAASIRRWRANQRSEAR